MFLGVALSILLVIIIELLVATKKEVKAMINYQLKGMFNQHSLFKLNDDNIANNDNRNNFAQIILGNQESESLKYLLNVNHQRLSDFKSMLAYNESNYAALVNEHQMLNKIKDEDTRSLPKSDKKIKESFIMF